MLAMKESCERCSRPLAADDTEVSICSFECTFCEACASEMGNRCPNCSGTLVPRPPRTVGGHRASESA